MLQYVVFVECRSEEEYKTRESFCILFCVNCLHKRMNQEHTIKKLPNEERPYEKCERFGPGVLTDTELLAVILRSGKKGRNVLEVSRELLFGDAVNEKGILALYEWDAKTVQKVDGIGKVKAVQVVCIAELARRLSKATAALNLSFSSPKTIAKYYMEDMRHLKQEHMKLLMLDTKTRLIGESLISKGTVNATLVSPRELFIEALQKNAVSIILLHNHPSGEPAPSREDLLVTKRIKEAGSLIGIELLDHIIIGNNCYLSFAEKKLL